MLNSSFGFASPPWHSTISTQPTARRDLRHSARPSTLRCADHLEDRLRSFRFTGIPLKMTHNVYRCRLVTVNLWGRDESNSDKAFQDFLSSLRFFLVRPHAGRDAGKRNRRAGA